MDSPVTGFSDGMVLRSGTMLHFAQNLKKIGEFYYSSQEEINEINKKRDELWQQRDQTEEVTYEDLTSPEIQRLEKSTAAKMRRAMDLTVTTKKEVKNARLRLDNEGFDDELEIMENYIKILGQELEMEQERVTEIVQDDEIAPTAPKRSFQDHLTNLFREMTLDLRAKGEGIVAVSGFTTRKGTESELLDLLNEMAILEIGKIDALTLVERDKLDAILEEQELALSDLMDTTRAIDVGKLLTANFIITGSVIEMASSVVIFGRIINVETGEVESVAQVIIPKDRDVQKLLT